MGTSSSLVLGPEHFDHFLVHLLGCTGVSEACELADGSAVVFSKGLRLLKLVNQILS